MLLVFLGWVDGWLAGCRWEMGICRQVAEHLWDARRASGCHLGCYTTLCLHRPSLFQLWPHKQLRELAWLQVGPLSTFRVGACRSSTLCYNPGPCTHHPPCQVANAIACSQAFSARRIKTKQAGGKGVPEQAGPSCACMSGVQHCTNRGHCAHLHLPQNRKTVKMAEMTSQMFLACVPDCVRLPFDLGTFVGALIAIRKHYRRPLGSSC